MAFEIARWNGIGVNCQALDRQANLDGQFGWPDCRHGWLSDDSASLSSCYGSNGRVGSDGGVTATAKSRRRVA